MEKKAGPLKLVMQVPNGRNGTERKNQIRSRSRFHIFRNGAYPFRSRFDPGTERNGTRNGTERNEEFRSSFVDKFHQKCSSKTYLYPSEGVGSGVLDKKKDCDVVSFSKTIISSIILSVIDSIRALVHAMY